MTDRIVLITFNEPLPNGADGYLMNYDEMEDLLDEYPLDWLSAEIRPADERDLIFCGEAVDINQAHRWNNGTN